MPVRSLTSADPTTTSNSIELTKNPGLVASTRPQQPTSLQSFLADKSSLAKYIAANSYSGSDPNPPVISAGPDYTFGPKERPTYNPVIDQLGTSPTSDNGQVAANALLRMEQSSLGGPFGVSEEAQFVTQQLAAHKNDPLFLQQYFGTLGPERTANIFHYLTSLGHVRTPTTSSSPNTADAAQLQQQQQDLADALSTMVKSKDFSQKDMDRLLVDFANGHPEDNFTFPKDVLGKASPEVNQMFYQSAKDYALKPGNANSTAGQAMAAYAMQALSQTSNPMAELASMPNDQLSNLVKAAMKGEARYGNPPSLEDFAKTGIYRASDGKGQPLDGLSHLIFDAAYSDVSDRFSRAPLTTDQAQNLQARLFQATVDSLQADPALHAFYNNSVPMKDALAADFQQGYDSIVKANSGPDGELSSAGMQNFQEFFGDVLFTPPPSSNAAGVAQFFQGTLNNFVADANKLPPGAHISQPQQELGTSLGEQAQAMAGALKQSLTSILNGQIASTKGTQDTINLLLTTGEAGVGALGVAPAIGAAIVGEALKGVVASGADPSIQSAIKDLKSHGIDVSKYTSGTLQDQSESIKNYDLRLAFQNGLNNANRVLN